MYSDKQVKDVGIMKSVLSGFLKAVLAALGFTLVVFFIAALLLTYTGLSEGSIPFITTVTMVLSVMLAGAVSARAGKSRGYLNGALTGILYVLVLYIVSLLVSGSFSCSSYILVLLAIGIFGGAFGGILGVNISAKRKRY
ncbi:MAG: TIGR04086 family membrane protein [Clostridia bacterium]|nr:TIGR04086 family membrane protein [Clostridia bacterium]